MIAKSHFRWLPSLVLCALGLTSLVAQDRLKSMPGYDHYQEVTRQMTNVMRSGALSVTWQDGGQAFEYTRDGKHFRYDIAARRLQELPAGRTKAAPESPRRSGRRSERPERGRQFTQALAPDGQKTALYRDRNVWLGDANGSNAMAVTTGGNARDRIKFGTANWVYGEELYQTTAMWWNTNSQKLAFYRFDESQVPDYYLALEQTKFQDVLDAEPYMKVGATNPVVDILVYDLTTKQTMKMDVRSGAPFSDPVLGHYVYGVSWTVDGKELLFHRTNRRQNIMELCAADPQTGKVRVIVREEWLPSWTENLPPIRWLADGRRFIWTSQRNGWKNLYLYDLSGTLLATLTCHEFDVEDLVRVDEAAGLVYYRAHDGDNPLKLQLHVVRFDGQSNRRLTQPHLHHTVDIAPDGRHFIDVAQTHDLPPFTRLMDAEGRLVAELAYSDMSRFEKLRLRQVELLKFKAADGTNDLYGMLHFPSDFRPGKKYPLLVSVYAGPETVGAQETFTQPNQLTEYGFLVASFDSRSASGRGKRLLDAIFQKLGRTEVDDQAAGVRSLYSRRYVDSQRVGIFGTSYGGSVSATSILRYPTVFQAACACSAVTDYRNYDTIYAERYMTTPAENPEGFRNASVMTYATNLTGRLMIFYGTADNNVHPANSLQLIQALQKAGKSFEVQVGPDLGHTSVGRARMMEFFIENLVMRPPAKK
jgi:dipeptidyl-peptidase 4